MSKEVYSFSKLNSFHQCPHAWFMNYLERDCPCGYTGADTSFLETDHGTYVCPHCGAEYTKKEFNKLKPSQVENNFALYGTLNHSLFERYNKEELQLSELADVYTWEYDTAVTESWPNNKYVDLGEQYYKQGLEFWKHWDGFNYTDVVSEAYYEKDMSEFGGDYIIRGYIDMSGFDKDGDLVLIDFKSKKSFAKGEELHKYARQLYLYSLFLKDKYGVYPKKLRFFRYRVNEYTDIDFNIDDLHEAIAWANQTVEDIRNEWAYEQNPDMYFCMNLCGSREHCKCSKYFWWKNHN